MAFIAIVYSALISYLFKVLGEALSEFYLLFLIGMAFILLYPVLFFKRRIPVPHPSSSSNNNSKTSRNSERRGSSSNTVRRESNNEINSNNSSISIKESEIAITV